MRLSIINETAVHFHDGIADTYSRYVAVHGDINDGIPEIVYAALDSLGHGNLSYIQTKIRPHFLGWIGYYVRDGVLIITEIQSDVLEKLSNSEIHNIGDLNTQSIVKKYRSRIDNRYSRWIDNALLYIESQLIPSLNDQRQQCPHGPESKIDSISVELPRNLELGTRLMRMISALGRAGYRKIDQHTFNKKLI